MSGSVLQRLVNFIKFQGPVTSICSNALVAAEQTNAIRQHLTVSVPLEESAQHALCRWQSRQELVSPIAKFRKVKPVLALEEMRSLRLKAFRLQASVELMSFHQDVFPQLLQKELSDVDLHTGYFNHIYERMLPSLMALNPNEHISEQFLVATKRIFKEVLHDVLADMCRTSSIVSADDDVAALRQAAVSLVYRPIYDALRLGLHSNFIPESKLQHFRLSSQPLIHR